MWGIRRVCGAKGCPVLAHVFASPRMQHESPVQGAAIDAKLLAPSGADGSLTPNASNRPSRTKHAAVLIPGVLLFELVFSHTKLCTFAGTGR